MNLLIDTHVWFWALESPDQLGPVCRAILESPENTLRASTVSIVEFGQLQTAGRIAFKGTLESWVRRGADALQLQIVPLSQPAALLAYNLPGDFHKDPADRMLVATAIEDGLTLITADDRILAYPHVICRNARK
ncbi:MAG: type II toxin-antitoxin system VapC family toxin [Kiritimatiellia bacterium]